jgi:hypothetical protein
MNETLVFFAFGGRHPGAAHKRSWLAAQLSPRDDRGENWISIGAQRFLTGTDRGGHGSADGSATAWFQPRCGGPFWLPLHEEAVLVASGSGRKALGERLGGSTTN